MNSALIFLKFHGGNIIYSFVFWNSILNSVWLQYSAVFRSQHWAVLQIIVLLNGTGGFWSTCILSQLQTNQDKFNQDKQRLRIYSCFECSRYYSYLILCWIRILILPTLLLLKLSYYVIYLFYKSYFSSLIIILLCRVN